MRVFDSNISACTPEYAALNIHQRLLTDPGEPRLRAVQSRDQQKDHREPQRERHHGARPA